MYAYGRQDGALAEVSPELATGPKGRLRARLDHAVLAAENGRSAVVRASSFYGPDVLTSRSGAAELKALKDMRAIPALGSVDQPHSMTYIDDFGRAMVNIAREKSAHGQIWHAPVQPAITQRELLSEFSSHLGAEPKFRLASLPLLKFLGLFNPTMKALQETYYSHAEPFVVSSDKYSQAFNDHPTPLSSAVEATLRSNNLI
jgi:nucleoside-diphosphate-sugar epimerase